MGSFHCHRVRSATVTRLTWPARSPVESVKMSTRNGQASDYVERGKEVLADQRDHLVADVAAGKQAYQAEPQSKSNP
jgi:hypothetical protein